MAHERTRYYQETREGIYNGPLFLVAQLLQSIPLSLFTTLIGALIIFRGLKNELLCTENPSSGERSCMPYSDVTQNKLGNFLLTQFSKIYNWKLIWNFCNFFRYHWKGKYQLLDGIWLLSRFHHLLANHMGLLLTGWTANFQFPHCGQIFIHCRFIIHLYHHSLFSPRKWHC